MTAASGDDRRPSASGEPVDVLILNQHGDNRGDEAALRAMLAGIEAHAATPVRFTILHQFARGQVDIDLPHEVRWIHLVPSPLEGLGLMLFSLAMAVGVRARWVLGRWGRMVADAYTTAEVAVSAPGGPYFGDPYASHELVHWLYVWLAHRHELPVALYAPSVGPFEKRWLNPIRRRLFRRFSGVSVRESVSKGHLEGLVGELEPAVVLAADSAMQRPLEPLDRREYFQADRSHLADSLLVGVSVLQWCYPGHPDPAAAHERYERVVLDAVQHIHQRTAAHFLFVPQLYGAVHSDVAYLESVGRRLPEDVSWEIVDPRADSDHQQRIFGMSDIYFASRYHPQVFSISNAVPGVCIYYEHKQLGFIRFFGLERLAFPIDDLDGGRVRAALDEVIENRQSLSAEIARNIPEVRGASARSSRMVAELMPNRPFIPRGGS